jgi:hypothetical protein
MISQPIIFALEGCQIAAAMAIAVVFKRYVFAHGIFI